ncbi:hypothetical protein [Dyella caseinilytica]|uniref:Uncharacterized protein n=1 Tax=Dyella caseinilytica TaxID=1849581 RepID=A0ABX7GRM2_9GAMM|nr:hypothetical protein [Dyella caseinilytica]QRN53016.1 hypothetical protein ISN74_16470 [Dyella caseinilytica]GGA10795.1 hypothetical protein GCM10011408_35130 [Dyella caseinilytica]
MKFRKIALAAGLLVSSAVQAGPYSDELSKCMVGKSTMDDHMVLVQWMFAAMSRHPAIAPMAKISDADLDRINEQAASLFMRMLTVTCRDEAKLALKNEGDMALQHGFNQLGELAGRELFINPDVMKGMSGLSKYIDRSKIDELKQ